MVQLNSHFSTYMIKNNINYYVGIHHAETTLSQCLNVFLFSMYDYLG